MKRLISCVALLVASCSSSTVAFAQQAPVITPTGSEIVTCVKSGVPKSCTTQGIASLGPQPSAVTARTVYAGPLGGSPVTPAFRILQTSDLPVGTSGPVIPLTSGSNTWSDTQTVIKNVNPVTDGANVLSQNSAKTAYQIYSPAVPAGYYFYGTNRAVYDNEPGTTVQGGAAFDAYTYNNVAVGTAGNEKNTVGLFVNGFNAVDGAKTWGLNTSCDDNTTNGLATLNNRVCIGYEVDFTANGASTFEGIPLILQGPGTPVSANALHISVNSGSTAKWTAGLVIDDGAILSSGKAIQIGALATSGASTPGQWFNAAYFDGSAAEQFLQMRAANGAWNINSTASGDGIYFLPTASNAYIGVAGTSANINVQVTPKGAGILMVNSAVSATGYIAGSSTGVSCAAGTVSLATLVVTNGIVTHC